MKLLPVPALFLILFYALFATSEAKTAVPIGYRKLTSPQITKSTLIQDLRQLGANYLLDKAIFQQKPSLPNGLWQITKTEGVWKKVSSTVTYYRYIVQIKCQVQPKLIRATYIVAFNSQTGGTRVISFSYVVLPNDPIQSSTSDAPSFVDSRLVLAGSDLQNLLDQGVEYTVKDAIINRLIKNSRYFVTRIYWVKGLGFSIVPSYIYSVLLTSSQGYSYRTEITSYNNTNSNPPSSLNPSYKIYTN